jgi:membrane-bound lytic murein transglycosylase F
MRKLLLFLLLLLALICDPGFVAVRPVPPISAAGELVVLTQNSPTTRFIDADGRYAGLEYELVEMFAAEMKLRVRYRDRLPQSQLLPALERHQAHLAAAGIAITSDRISDFQFGPAYQMVQTVLAYNTNDARPRDLPTLVGKRIEVVKGSAAIEDLELLRRRFPGLRWTEVEESDSEGLLSRLSEGKTDFVVADSHVLDVVRKFYPNLARAFTLGEPKPLAWAFSNSADPQLMTQAREFFLRIIYDGTLRQLLERYYGHVQQLDPFNIAKFLDHRITVLPRYATAFKEAQELTGIDWRLLAALGFQESHWDPLAVSPTGVRGMMMLTSETADRMGLTDRLDAHQSILAGAKYLLDLKETLPARIAEPDRTWLALAAYNIGYGHLEDARILTQRRGLDPDLWVDVKQALPLLSRYEHYSTVKNGFCRGGEALVLTENIRSYYDILRRFEPPHAPGFKLTSGPRGRDKRLWPFPQIGARPLASAAQ